ncbi:MAG TPA: YggS family pyridoxal phosphate-dependent enzyme [Gammaproteobacteria bacterium]|nr:YggS family pyridoxal phosphate-dependent enzyme [Gammaproteobacteria bacterium]
MEDVARNLEAVRTRIRVAAEKAGRDPGSVRLLAVGKTQPAEALAAAWEAGQRDFGENYLQEALPKMAALADRSLSWHFIGNLQSNKTRETAERFDWVHTVDRESIARRLSDQRPVELPPLHICLQVNVSGEGSKGGAAPERLSDLADAVAGLPHLKLRGLMAIPAPARGLEEQRLPHRRLRELQEELNRRGHTLDTLSMGMSGDLEAAVMEGATIVRIGTAIFGERPPKPG